MWQATECAGAGRRDRRGRPAPRARPRPRPPRWCALARALSGPRRGGAPARAAGRSSAASSRAGRRAPSSRCSSPICAPPDAGRALLALALVVPAAVPALAASALAPALTGGSGVRSRSSCPRARRSPATAASRAAPWFRRRARARSRTRSGSGRRAACTIPSRARARARRARGASVHLARRRPRRRGSRRSSPSWRSAPAAPTAFAYRGRDRVGVAHALRPGRVRRRRRCSPRRGRSAVTGDARERPRARSRRAARTAMQRRGARARRRRARCALSPASASSRVRGSRSIRTLGVAEGGGRRRDGPVAAGVELRASTAPRSGVATACVSGDRHGRRRRARSRSGSACPALFVNGAVGDVSPAPAAGAGVARPGRSVSRRRALGAWDAITAGGRCAPRDRASERVRAARARGVGARTVWAGWVPALAARGTARCAAVAAPGCWRSRSGGSAVGDHPGRARDAARPRDQGRGRRELRATFVAGVSNDYLGYFLTPEDYARAELHRVREPLRASGAGS